MNYQPAAHKGDGKGKAKGKGKGKAKDKGKGSASSSKATGKANRKNHQSKTVKDMKGASRPGKGKGMTSNVWQRSDKNGASKDTSKGYRRQP